MTSTALLCTDGVDSAHCPTVHFTAPVTDILPACES